MNKNRNSVIKLLHDERIIIYSFIEYLNNFQDYNDDYLIYNIIQDRARSAYFNAFNLDLIFTILGGKNLAEWDFDLSITEDYEYCYFWRGNSTDIDKFINYINNHVDYNKYLLKNKLDEKLETKQITKKVKI